MKVVLINPAQTDKIRNSLYKTISPVALPLGIAYLAAVLEKNHVEVLVFDQCVNGMSNDELVAAVINNDPQLVGLSCLTPAMGNVIRLIKKIRKDKKNIKVVLGNIHATVFADQILEKGWADFIVRGEGEYSFLELVLALNGKKSMNDVDGISFRDCDRIIHNRERSFCGNLDELPYPAYHLFDLELYNECGMLCIYEKFLPIQASRGCSYRCTFCSQDKIFKKVRTRTVKCVIDEIEYMHDKFKVNCFVFEDASFPFSIEYGMEFCDEFIKRELHKQIKWVTEMRVDLVNLKLLERMKKSGLHLILYGFEFGNQRILDSVRKGITLEQSREAMYYSRKAGIITFGLFMFGMPTETRETCLDTIKFSKELNCDFAKFNIAIPLPGSEFFNEYKDKIKGMNSFDEFTSWSDWSNNKRISLPYDFDGMTSEDLFDFQKKAMFEFYFRPTAIINIIKKRLVPFKKLFSGGLLLILQNLRYIFRKIMMINVD